MTYELNGTYYTIDDIAKKFGITPDVVRKVIRKLGIKGEKIGCSSIYTQQDVETYDAYRKSSIRPYNSRVSR